MFGRFLIRSMYRASLIFFKFIFDLLDELKMKPIVLNNYDFLIIMNLDW